MSPKDSLINPSPLIVGSILRRAGRSELAPGVNTTAMGRGWLENTLDWTRAETVGWWQGLSWCCFAFLSGVMNFLKLSAHIEWFFFGHILAIMTFSYWNWNNVKQQHTQASHAIPSSFVGIMGQRAVLEMLLSKTVCSVNDIDKRRLHWPKQQR